MSTACLLCPLVCCCCYVNETLGTAVNAGLKIRLSESGLNYVASVAVQRLVDEMRGASLPDRSGKVHVPVICRVNYEVNRMKVCVECDYVLILSLPLLQSIVYVSSCKPPLLLYKCTRLYDRPVIYVHVYTILGHYCESNDYIYRRRSHTLTDDV